MPSSLPRRCSVPTCGNLATKGARCPTHQTRRPSAASRGYDAAWNRRRKAFLAQNPRCLACGARATVADHIIPRRILVAQGAPDPDTETNLQPLCETCHNTKTARQDGGFGR